MIRHFHLFSVAVFLQIGMLVAGCTALQDGQSQVIYIPTANGVEAQTVSLGRSEPEGRELVAMRSELVRLRDVYLSGSARPQGMSIIQLNAGYSDCLAQDDVSIEKVNDGYWGEALYDCLLLIDVSPPEIKTAHEGLLFFVVDIGLGLTSATSSVEFEHFFDRHKHEMIMEYRAANSGPLIIDVFAYIYFEDRVFQGRASRSGLQKNNNPWFAICGRFGHRIQSARESDPGGSASVLADICRVGGVLNPLTRRTKISPETLWEEQ